MALEMVHNQSLINQRGKETHYPQLNMSSCFWVPLLLGLVLCQALCSPWVGRGTFSPLLRLCQAPAML